MSRKKSKSQRAAEKEKQARRLAAQAKQKQAEPKIENPVPDPETEPAADPNGFNHHFIADVSGSMSEKYTPSRPASPAGRPFMRQPSGRKSIPVDMSLDPVRDAGGDCWEYQVTLPRNADLSVLFNGIRSTRPREESGTVYIRTDIMDATAGNAQLIYDYTFGMFMRRVEGSKKDLLLANLLDQPIMQIRAKGGWGQMNYFVNLACSTMPADDNAEIEQEVFA